MDIVKFNSLPANLLGKEILEKKLIFQINSPRKTREQGFTIGQLDNQLLANHGLAKNRFCPVRLDFPGGGRKTICQRRGLVVAPPSASGYTLSGGGGGNYPDWRNQPSCRCHPGGL
jgi:hypothetical protein